MKVREKIQLISDIAQFFQDNYSYNKISEILSYFDLPENGDYNGPNSKRLYTEHKLRGVSDEVILQIAEDFDVPFTITRDGTVLPRNWQDDSSVKIFISHLSKDKDIANKIKKELSNYNATSFVAHEDIHPTSEWEKEIKKALSTMDIFISVHTLGFSKSVWCQQEVGYAIGSGKKVIPVKFNENPPGFLSSIQALPRGKKTAKELIEIILLILKDDKNTNELYKKLLN